MHLTSPVLLDGTTTYVDWMQFQVSRFARRRHEAGAQSFNFRRLAEPTPTAPGAPHLGTLPAKPRTPHQQASCHLLNRCSPFDIQERRRSGEFHITHTHTMSILNRKRDLVYLLFFLIHIPVIFCEPSTMPPGRQHEANSYPS